MAHRVLSIFRRRLFTCLTILSLLLCLATVALWVRSYWRYDAVRYATLAESKTRGVTVGNVFGGVNFSSFQISGNSFNPPLGLHYSTYQIPLSDIEKSWMARDPGDRAFSFFGFHYLFERQPQITGHAIALPHWFLVLLFAILPTLRLRSLLRTRRENRIGLCQHCGYDLRATPDRCPECGHLPNQQLTTIN